ncbi:carbohydrate ABC transporter permease [Cohnella cellulosilytica]|uniref:Carbohydrate ABC transporter permease n=1 Tax=Cohnella cellulosilytica TaxID=986710 RepID=A0ABW2F4Z5_9BACL
MGLERDWGTKAWTGFIYGFLVFFSLLALIPFISIIAGSFTSATELAKRGFVLIPTEFSLEAYHYIFSAPTIPRSMLVSILVTVFGTLINLLLTSLMAYPLSRRDLPGRRQIMFLVVFAMLFNGGMIPTFIVVKSLGLIDTYWSLVLPIAIIAFNLIILRSFFQQLPEGLEEAAKIDGCNDLVILFRIVLPLSMPALATLALFYGVMHWNSFFNAILYINDADKWPVQVWLRQIVLMSTGGFTDTSAEGVVPPSQTIKMAVIVVSTLPIMLIYPFLQKHFAKGALIGSVKG